MIYIVMRSKVSVPWRE